MLGEFSADSMSCQHIQWHSCMTLDYIILSSLSHCDGEACGETIVAGRNVSSIAIFGFKTRVGTFFVVLLRRN